MNWSCKWILYKRKTGYLIKNCKIYFRVLVRLGELDATMENACDNGLAPCSEPQDFQIESIIHHSGYDNPKYAHDIALIRLLRPANSSIIRRQQIHPHTSEIIFYLFRFHQSTLLTDWSIRCC